MTGTVFLLVGTGSSFGLSDDGLGHLHFTTSGGARFRTKHVVIMMVQKQPLTLSASQDQIPALPICKSI